METENPNSKPRFCIRTYFKTRALKQIVQWLIVSAVSIFLLSAFAVADAYAQGTCADLTGESTAITPPAPNGNSGILDLTDPPEPAYAAKICEPASIPGDFELYGWIWDNNLGWISLACTGGTNEGIPCGGVDYGTKINIETGEMYGWAWGDNIGWISFGCSGGANDGASCGSVDYSGDVDIVIDENLGKFHGYAWADTVGWFHLEGIEARILQLMLKEGGELDADGNMVETDWGVWTKSEIADDGLTSTDKNSLPTKETAALADGNDGYDLFIHVADINGVSVDPADVTVDIETVWTDTVRYDQTSDDEIPLNYSDDNGGPVKKPSVASSGGIEFSYTPAESTTTGVVDSYYAKARSLAPTYGANCYDGDGDGTCSSGEGSGDFHYSDFAEGLTPNEVTYELANITVTLLATGEVATFSLAPIGFPGGYQMEFLPPLELTTVDYLPDPTNPSNTQNFIEAVRNKADYFNIDGTQHGSYPGSSYTVDLSLIENEADVIYGWIPDLEAEPPQSEADAEKSVSSINALDGEHIALPYAPESDLAGQIAGAALHSIINIQRAVGTPIIFYSNGLPRTVDSVIINQQVEIVSGSVFSPGAEQAVQNNVLTLLGDVASYTLREKVLRNVSSLTAGAQTEDLFTPFEIDTGTSATQLSPYKLKDGQLYYFKGNDVVISDIDVLEHPEGLPVTVIVEDGDLFLDDPDGVIDNGVWGFIVLEDTGNVSAQEKGGRMYINNNITDLVNAHIYADGPVFSYVDGICYFWGDYGPGNALTGLREPNFAEPGRCSSGGTYMEPVTNLNNQLYFRGTIASMNCIGCSIEAEPYRGDGKALGAPTALNFAIARLYDLNYFRYFRISAETGAPTGDRSTIVPTYSAIDAADKDLPFYVDYEPPPTGLLGFSGL